MLYKTSPTEWSRTQWRAASLVFALLAVQPIWEAWNVFSTGSMAGVHCNGRYAGSLCDVGIALGNLAFGTAKAHLGYGLVIGGLGTFMLAGAWLAFARAKYSVVNSE
jgi:hypothetical protein